MVFQGGQEAACTRWVGAPAAAEEDARGSPGLRVPGRTDCVAEGWAGCSDLHLLSSAQSRRGSRGVVRCRKAPPPRTSGGPVLPQARRPLRQGPRPRSGASVRPSGGAEGSSAGRSAGGVVGPGLGAGLAAGQSPKASACLRALSRRSAMLEFLLLLLAAAATTAAAEADSASDAMGSPKGGGGNIR